tara:strand:- start:20372 stop:22237 length:1866 start_codon:yes stop_codon:yes gene_type:complete
MCGLGQVLEELEVSTKAVRLGRLNNGAPFLNTHSDWSLGDVIGVVEKAWLDGSEGRALIRFSEREDVEPIWRDIKGGIIRNVSVGYRVHKYEVIEEDGAPTRVIAKDWEPMEISAVPIGADDLAGFRSEETENPCELQRALPANPQKETPMPTKDITPAGDAPNGNTETRAPAPAPAPQPAPVDTDAIRKEGITGERTRIADIQKIGRSLKIDDGEVSKLVVAGKTVDEARAAFIDILAARDEEGGEQRSRIRINVDEVDTRRSLAANAIEHRLMPGKVKLEDGARQYRGESLLEIGKNLLTARGETVRGLSKSEVSRLIMRGSHSTSDFPLILANVASKRLRSAYEAVPQTFRPIVNETTLADFKTTSVVALSEAPAFVQKLEGAEYKYGTVGESREQYNLATYGRGIRFTREMLINDDLRAFDRLLMSFGTSAANFESDLVWGIICSNAALADAVALFHADHANLVTAGAITVANLGAARAAMRKQTALAPSATESGSVLNLEPRYLAVPAELETVALQYTQQTAVITDPANQNVYANTMIPIIEPRLGSLSGGSADDWYLFADPNQIDTIEFAYLEGEQGPQIFQEDDWDTDGIKLKGRLDVAAKAIDYRGMVKNPGS